MGRVVKSPVELQAGSRPFLSYRFLDKYFDKRGVPMAENTKSKTNEQCHRADSSLAEKTTYDFDKNSFIVEPVFKTDKSETLGAVLLRLMTQKE
mgnify:CR=1 FL=1